MITVNAIRYKLTPEQVFMLSVCIVNIGNYIYNLILGRFLGPKEFADAAILITFLLILSFLAMTFQLVVAKYAALFEKHIFNSFYIIVVKIASIIGLILGVLFVIFSNQLQFLFNTASSAMFKIFGLAVPFYFLMSLNRGVFQGKKELKPLSITYQTEMLSRLIITFLLLLIFNIQSSTIVAIGIFISLICGLFPFKFLQISVKSSSIISFTQRRKVLYFFMITAFYELTQIIINNSDVLLVKHYFSSYDAGLYASLALIGRAVYFMTWMFVMLLLPTVVELKKEGKDTLGVLFKYVGYITLISVIIITACLCFPKTIIKMLFGDSYLSMASLLWKYAFATSMFAVSNIFVYYFLSINSYIPVLTSAVFGLLQVVLIMCFHQNLNQILLVQILCMGFLLFMQLFYFFNFRKNS